MLREAFFPQDDITLVAPALYMLSQCMFTECGNICLQQILTESTSSWSGYAFLYQSDSLPDVMA